MVSLEKFLRPDFPEGRSTELAEGKIMGWVPGEISSLDDPEKLGRVKVRCDLIQQDEDLPNHNDGWVWVLESFVVNAQAGGSHRLLKVGAQCALLPMLGDPRQMLLLGCIPSRVDRPSPELDRSKELHGAHTPGQVYDINNDADGSWINTRPNGVTEHISGGGDRSIQTRDQGKLDLKADGTVSTSNPKGSTTIAPTGTISTSNQAGGTSVLSDTGNWQLQSANQTALKLDGSNALMHGPMGKVGELSQQLKKTLPGVLGKGEDLLRQIQALVPQLGKSELALTNLAPLTKQLHELLARHIPEASKIISEFQKIPGEEIAEHLVNQAQKYLDSGLNQVEEMARNVLKDAEGDIDKFLSGLESQLPEAFKGKLKPEAIAPILNGLSHDPGMQVQTVLQQFAQFDDFKNLVGLNLHEKLGDIDKLFGSVANAGKVVETLNFNSGLSSNLNLTPGFNPSAGLSKATGSLNLSSDLKLTPGFNPNISLSEADFNLLSSKGGGGLNLDKFLDVKSGVLSSLLPESLSGFFGKESTSQLLQLALTGGNPMGLLMSNAAQGLIGDIVPDLERLTKNIPVLGNLSGVIGQLSKGGIPDLGKLTEQFPDFANPTQLLEKALPGALGSIGETLGGLFGGGKKKAKRLLNGVGSNEPGGTVKATKDKVEAQAGAGGMGAKLEITKPKASLKGLGSEIFAGMATAGITTPWGSFGLGEEGGDLLTKGKMAFKVLQDAGKVASLLMSKDKGVAIASFKDKDDKNPSAAVNVDEGVVDIFADGGREGIRVSPEGVYLGDYRVVEYLDDFVRWKKQTGSFQTQITDTVSESRNESLQKITQANARIDGLESLRWFRVTRNALYPSNFPLESRQGYYVQAKDEAQVTTQFSTLFPDEIASGFSVELSSFGRL